MDHACKRIAASLLGAAVCLGASSAHALTYQNASMGLPPTHMWDCNTVLFEQCNNPSDSGGWVGVDLADVDGDGDEDIVAVGRLLQGYHVWLSDGAGNWTESSTGLDPDECHGRSEVAFGDVNADGAPDFGGIRGINGAPGVFLGDGTGSWTSSDAGLSGSGGEGFTFGDFDGDGNQDLAATGHLGGPMKAFFGDGSGGWTENSSGLPQDVWAHRMTAADFDGDGRDEVVDTIFNCSAPNPRDPCSLPFERGVHIWRLGQDNIWDLWADFYFDQAWEPAAADLDGDGWLDLVVSSRQYDTGTRGNVRAFRNNGDGTFTDSSIGLPMGETFHAGLDLGDMDNDGDIDIVVGDTAGEIRVFLNDGLAGTWTEAAGTGLPTGLDTVESVGVGDADGDCLLDIGYAAYTCGVQLYEQTDPPACPILAEAGAPAFRCEEDAGTLTLDAVASRACGCAPGEIRYRWFDEAGLLRDWDAASSITVAPAASTLYRVDVACSGDLTCFVSDTVRVRVQPTPAPTVDPPAAEICEGESAQLSGMGAWSSVVWSTDPPGAPDDGATVPLITPGPLQTTTYTFEVVDDVGCTGSADVVVTVHPLPQPSVDPVDPELCQGEEVVLSVTGTWDSVSWTTDPPGQPGDGATDPALLVAPDQTTTYTVEVTDANGCTAAASTTVTVHATPSPTVDPMAAEICEGEEADLTVSGSWSGVAWTSDPPGQPGDGATDPALSVAPDQTTTYTVEVTDADGCTGTAASTVTVHATPSPTILASRQEICTGDPAVDLSVSDTWSNVAWSTDPPGRPGDGSTAPAIQVDPTATTTYTVTVTGPEGCVGTDTLELMVHPLPQPTVLPQDPSICAFDSVDLEVPGDWQQVTWTTDPLGEPGDGATDPMISVSPGITTTYSVTVTDENGCVAATGTEVEVRPNPEPFIEPLTPSICPGEQLELTVAGGPWESVEWFTSPQGQPGDGATSATILVSPTVGTTYRADVIRADGCDASASAFVVLEPDDIPGPVGPGLRVERDTGGALRTRWQDIGEDVGRYEIVAHEAADGPPTATAMDAGAVVAWALPSAETARDPDGATTPAGLVFLKVRATSPCSNTPGPTSN